MSHIIPVAREIRAIQLGFPPPGRRLFQEVRRAHDEVAGASRDQALCRRLQRFAQRVRRHRLMSDRVRLWLVFGRLAVEDIPNCQKFLLRLVVFAASFALDLSTGKLVRFRHVGPRFVGVFRGVSSACGVSARGNQNAKAVSNMQCVSLPFQRSQPNGAWDSSSALRDDSGVRRTGTPGRLAGTAARESRAGDSSSGEVRSPRSRRADNQ